MGVGFNRMGGYKKKERKKGGGKEKELKNKDMSGGGETCHPATDQ